ncbi:Retrovirus-related Pol poly from transposon, partial [Brachionus plicatilis]
MSSEDENEKDQKAQGNKNQGQQQAPSGGSGTQTQSTANQIQSTTKSSMTLNKPPHQVLTDPSNQDWMLIAKNSIEESRVSKKYIAELEAKILNLQVLNSQYTNMWNKKENMETPTTSQNEQVQFQQATYHAIQKESGYRPNRNVPIFKGNKNEDLDNWFLKVEQSFENDGIGRDLWLKYANFYLDESALHNYRIIIEEFPQTDWMNSLRNQITNIKQTSNFDDYLNRFKNIAGQLNEISQKFKMQCFINGLQPKTKTYVKLQNPKTFEDAIDMATRSEKVLGYNNQKVMMSANTHNRDKSLVCRNCKKVGHIAKECRSKKNGSKSNDNKTPTGNYKKHASNNYNRHGTENSRNGIKYQKKSYMAEVKKDDPDLQNIISKYETKSYMLRYEQSNFLGAKHVKLLDVPANVDNNIVTGILDTGSTTSVISNDLVDRLGIKYEKPEYSIIVASGPNVRCPITNLQDNILVGLDWFNETDVIIDSKNRRAFIPPEPSDSLYEDDMNCFKEYSFLSEINEDEIDLLEFENDTSWNTNSNQHLIMQSTLIDEKVLNEQELSNLSLFMETINDVFATDYNNFGRCKMRKHKEDRKNYIEIAHLVGHYGPEATTKRLKEQYYWKNMDKDVEFIIDKCVQCQKHNKERQVYHPAKELQKSDLDRMSEDNLKSKASSQASSLGSGLTQEMITEICKISKAHNDAQNASFQGLLLETMKSMITAMRPQDSLVSEINPEQKKKSNKITSIGQPNFTGNENIMEWIRITERNLTISDVAEECKVTAACIFLRGDAEKAIDDWLVANPRQIWDDFKNFLIKEFTKPEEAHLSLTRLRRLTQTGDLREYAEQFTRLASQLARPMCEEDKVIYIQNGLSDTLRTALWLKEPKTLKEAIKMASSVYYSNDIGEKSSVNSVSKYSIEIRACHFCKKQGHLKAECRKLAQLVKNKNRTKTNEVYKRVKNIQPKPDENFNKVRTENGQYQNPNDVYNQRNKRKFVSYKKNGKNVNSVDVEYEVVDDEEITYVTGEPNEQPNVYLTRPRNFEELVKLLSFCRYYKQALEDTWSATRILFKLANSKSWYWNGELENSFRQVINKLKSVTMIGNLQKRKNRAIKNISREDIKMINVNKDADKNDTYYEETPVSTIECGSTNHVQEIRQVPELMKGKALIGKNDLEVEVIFDTGAKRSVIPEDLIHKHKLPISHKLIRAVVANNQIHRTHLTEKLRLIFNGLISELEFIILPRQNILLGMDWFVANNASIDPADERFTLGQEADIEDDNFDEDFEAWDFRPNEAVKFQKFDELNEKQNTDALRILNNYKSKESSSKDTDFWEDEPLLHYLETGKFKPGASQKQCKRIMEKSKNLTFNDGRLIYHENETNAHLLGHFGNVKTYKYLCENYWWRGMYRDVESFVRNCLTCIRHQKTPIWDHPALTLPIRDVGDLVQIDLVFGLPVTKNGNKGICKIIESCAKFLYFKAIKSKESEEIARKYFEYISIFGSSKELLSDQGKEFLNKMMEKLIKLTGTER